MYHLFDDKTHIYLVLEFMEEGPLFKQLKKTKILKEKDVKNKIKQIGSAINYLQDNDIAHRDIKPENIVMSNVLFYFIFRVFVNYAISDGRLFAKPGDLHIVGLLIILLPKY